jgi:hypothetical protein
MGRRETDRWGVGRRETDRWGVGRREIDRWGVGRQIDGVSKGGRYIDVKVGDR